MEESIIQTIDENTFEIWKDFPQAKVTFKHSILKLLQTSFYSKRLSSASL
jgi:hypothetical protein